jgi:predicted nucleic acid-binding protein
LLNIVVDSSVGACWAMPDEFSLTANRTLEALASGTMLVPSLFWFELANVLVVNLRRGRIEGDRIAAAIDKVLALSYRTEELEPDLSTTIALARAHNLTVYDAAYLELATRTGARLATLDRRLAVAAAAEGIELINEAT